MKFKLIPLFTGLVQVEFEDGECSSPIDTRHKADFRLCGIIQALQDGGFEYEESFGDNERLGEIVAASSTWC